MLMRFDPFRDLDQLTERLWPIARAPYLPMDAIRHGDTLEVSFDLPGVDPASIDVTVEGNTLTVKAERSWSPSEGAEVIVSERPHGSFTRQLSLGDGLDADRLEAHCEHGVLILRIPVAETARARRVEITSGGPQALEAISAAA
jgi:HSP20 family protein